MPQYMPSNLFYYAMFHINAKIIYSLKQLNLNINYKYGITYEILSRNKIIYLNLKNNIPGKNIYRSQTSYLKV